MSPCNSPITVRELRTQEKTLLVIVAALRGSPPCVLVSDTKRYRSRVIWGLPPAKQGCFSRQWQSLRLCHSLPGYLQLCDPLFVRSPLEPFPRALPRHNN